MKIAAVCITYMRPKQLAYMLWCFEHQDHEDRELVILDDAGQYENSEGDRWRLVSVAQRYPTLGDKRNAAATLVSDDVEALAVWDDDDLYLSHALGATVAALTLGHVSRPSEVLHPDPSHLLYRHETGGLFHGGWGYGRAMFEQVGGYPAMNNGEDQVFLQRLDKACAVTADPIHLMDYKPFYVFPWEYNWCEGGPSHISGAGPRGYQKRGAIKPTGRIRIASVEPPIDLLNPRFADGLHPRKF